MTVMIIIFCSGIFIYFIWAIRLYSNKKFNSWKSWMRSPSSAGNFFTSLRSFKIELHEGETIKARTVFNFWPFTTISNHGPHHIFLTSKQIVLLTLFADFYLRTLARKDIPYSDIVSVKIGSLLMMPLIRMTLKSGEIYQFTLPGVFDTTGNTQKIMDFFANILKSQKN